ncbi:hypothetical protein FSB08_26095 [Paraburkholderia sp. JPY432]|uniref:hypothetical protein n=1 Tax=Paraburkholderia TaxID=1822464 RepID=UPI0015961CF5|nr:hypothetical protein [Paraburkholderia youngii]NVH75912.1 hypothetical protein [Paraburkholderia youngii]
MAQTRFEARVAYPMRWSVKELVPPFHRVIKEDQFRINGFVFALLATHVPQARLAIGADDFST